MKEWVALGREVNDTIGVSAAVAALAEAIGADRAGKLFAEVMALYERDGENMQFHSEAFTKRENHALVRSLYKRIPGDTEQAKIDWAAEHGSKCFESVARFEEVLAYCLDRIVSFKAKGGTIDRYPVELGPVGYGRVNQANADWTKTEADLRECAARGVKFYAWEMAGWGDGEIWNDPARVAGAIDMAGKIVGLCRELGMTAFPSILNRNMVLTKYHHTAISLESVWDQAISLVAGIKALGPANMVVQLIAEQESDEKIFLKFERHAKAELAGFDLVDNLESRPKTKRAGYKYRAWHPCETSSTPSGDPSDCIVVSDCGTIIRALASNGALDGPGDPAKLKAWAGRLVAKGFAGAVYYAFQRADNDFPAIAAMGEAGGGGTATVVLSDDAIDFGLLRWTDGGFDGSKAVLSAPRLSAPVFGARRVDFSWLVGMESWGYDREQADGVFCLFTEQPDGTFAGGKMEWISTSRTYRELGNLFSGEYRRDLSGVSNPCRTAIVVVSKDGTKRGNVVAGEWQR